jgi:type I restriction enzyme S subunit
MFGDWSRPGFNGALVQLGTQLDFLTSGSRGWAEYYRDSGSLFLRIQNVRQDELDLSDVAFVDPPVTAEARRTKVRAGDVLLSITADLGRTAVVPNDIGEAFINQHLSILRSSKLEPRYLSAALSSRAGQIAIQKKNREGVKAGLNFDDVRTLEIPDVDPAIQRAFATRVAEIDKLKLQHRTHLAKLDALFASLQHRAFRGEL